MESYFPPFLLPLANKYQKTHKGTLCYAGAQILPTVRGAQLTSYLDGSPLTPRKIIEKTTNKENSESPIRPMSLA